MRKPIATPLCRDPQQVAKMIAHSRKTPFLYSGMLILESDLCVVPRMTLSEKVPVTPEFRAEINAWMLEFFGTEDRVFFFKDPASGAKTAVLSPRAVEQLRRETKPLPFEPLAFK